MEKKKILIVEDENDLRELLVELLTEAGYEVFQAIDGQVALERIQTFKPDLVITDVLMPNLRGDDLVKAARAVPGGRKIPFIVLTARKLMKEYFEDLDIEEFIAKPCGGPELLEKIDAVFQKTKIFPDQKQSAQTPPHSDPANTKKDLCKKCGEPVNPSFFRCPNCGSMYFNK